MLARIWLPILLSIGIGCARATCRGDHLRPPGEQFYESELPKQHASSRWGRRFDHIGRAKCPRAHGLLSAAKGSLGPVPAARVVQQVSEIYHGPCDCGWASAAPRRRAGGRQ